MREVGVNPVIHKHDAIRHLFAWILVFSPVTAAGQQSELFRSCLEEGSYCSESPPETLETFGRNCGEIFYQFKGRVAFPPLVSTGTPITIAVKTFATTYTPFPLYVEIRPRTPLEDSLDCTTLLAGALVLVAQGSDQCGGLWESVGPIDLTQRGVALGKKYHVQLVFFEDNGSGWQSNGVSCIRVTSSPDLVVTNTWGRVKQLYR